MEGVDSMKYMVKKIIIGVAIGIILMSVRSCKVHADTYGSSYFSSIIVHYKFDVCLDTGGDFLCTEGLEDTQNIKNIVATLPIYTPKTNEYLMLKEFDVHLVTDNGVYVSNNYSINLPSPMTIFNGLNVKSTNDYNNMPRFNNITMYNNFVNYFAYKPRNETEYISVDSQYLGAYLGVQQLWLSGSSIYTYGVTPSVKITPTSYFYDFQYSLQSGYTYNGSNSIIQAVPTYTTNPPSISRTDFLNQYKTNSYLAVVYPGQSLSWKKISDLSSTANWSVTTGSYSTNSIYNISPSANEVLIQERLADINKELIVNASVIGSDIYGTDQENQFTNAFSNTITNASNNLNSIGFTSFLNALIVEPVALLNQSASVDFYDNGELTGSLCFDTFHQGGTNYGWIPIPFVDTGNYTTDYFQLPCMTTQVYSNLKSRNSHGIKNGRIIGFGDTPNSSADTLGGISFMPIWLLIQHAVLYVWLTITFVNIVKYCIDTKDSEIEVMDL